MVIAIGCTAPAPRPCTARNAISAGMLHASPHSTLPDQEQPDPEQHDRLAAEGVGELGVHRHRHRLGQQVHREQPRELGEPADVADDRRHRGREDRRVDRDQAGGHHEGEQHRPALGAQADAGAGGRTHTEDKPVGPPGIPAERARQPAESSSVSNRQPSRRPQPWVKARWNHSRVRLSTIPRASGPSPARPAGNRCPRPAGRPWPGRRCRGRRRAGRRAGRRTPDAPSAPSRWCSRPGSRWPRPRAAGRVRVQGVRRDHDDPAADRLAQRRDQVGDLVARHREHGDVGGGEASTGCAACWAPSPSAVSVCSTRSRPVIWPRRSCCSPRSTRPNASWPAAQAVMPAEVTLEGQPPLEKPLPLESE